MIDIKHDYCTFVQSEQLPAFLAYLGSFYHNADPTDERINVLACNWPPKILRLLSNHSRLNITSSENTKYQNSEHTGFISEVLTYLDWLGPIVHGSGKPVVSHYRPGIFLGPLDRITKDKDLDLLVARPATKTMGGGDEETILEALQFYTVVILTTVGYNFLTDLAKRVGDPNTESVRTNAVKQVKIDFIFDHGTLEQDLETANDAEYIWRGFSNAKAVPLSQSAKQWFGSIATKPSHAPGNYADVLMLEEWLIDTLKANKTRNY
jgi:hypothetical protein